MTVFKGFDCVVQLILIIAGAGMIIKTGLLFNEASLNAYFMVGGWQLLSVIVHFFYIPLYNTRLRKIYLITLGVVILLLVLSAPLGVILFALYGLLFFSPVMAVYYLYTCIKEIQYLNDDHSARGKKWGDQ